MTSTRVRDAIQNALKLIDEERKYRVAYMANPTKGTWPEHAKWSLAFSAFTPEDRAILDDLVDTGVEEGFTEIRITRESVTVNGVFLEFDKIDRMGVLVKRSAIAGLHDPNPVDFHHDEPPDDGQD